MFLWVLGGVVLLFAGYFAVQLYIRKAIVERAEKYSMASNPGRVKPSWRLLFPLTPGLYPHSFSLSMHKEMMLIRIFIARQLWLGASNPALVIQEKPFIVAAYAADCDAVLLLRFLPETVEDMKARGMVLSIGTKLLSINTYFRPGEEYKGDEVVLGRFNTGTWRTFSPFIAQFLCDDSQLGAIRDRQAEIPSEMWERTRVLGVEKMRDSDLDRVRWGNPMFVRIPGSYKTAIEHAREWKMDY